MTLPQLNLLPSAKFVEELGWIYEHSPWVAEQAWKKRPFASVAELHAAMTAVMESAPRDAQLALLRAHPELGSRAPMSAASEAEQARLFGAGGPPLPEELERYRQKFGFPFIYAVRGAITPDDIGFALWIRIEESPEEEFRQALSEVRTIAWFRLQDKFQERASA
jgi:2-oxo-4-hydroxy-4-carboxy-5-ureidoimidazoline decarboxylase